MTQIRLPNRRVMQTSFIVDDLDDACMRWVRTTGIGPFLTVRNIPLTDFTYRGDKGEGIDFSVAIAQSGGVQIELVQQHCDRPSAYRDLIAKGAQGFHHICFYCDDAADYEATCDWYDRQGFVTAIDGRMGDMRFRYIDTSAAIGCMVELIDNHPMQTDFFGRIIDSAKDWDGVTDPVRAGF